MFHDLLVLLILGCLLVPVIGLQQVEAFLLRPPLSPATSFRYEKNTNSFIPSRVSVLLFASSSSSSDNDSNDETTAKEEGGLFYKGFRYYASKAASKVKQGGYDAADATTTRLAGLAEKGGSGVQSAVAATSAGLSKIADKSGAVANVATSNIVGFVEKGSADVTSVVSATTNTAGEIVRWIDGQAKEGANAANTQSKALVLAFTGKQDYKFGDISKELLRRIASSDIDMNDVALLLKVLLAIGTSFAPLAKALPITVLLEMLNISLEKQIGGKVLGVLAGSLDERFTAVFNNSDRFQLGDAVKRSAMSGILKFTGKDSYEEGDIERAVTGDKQKSKEETSQADGNNNGMAMSLPSVSQKTLEIRVGTEFEDWDAEFRQSCPDLDELEGINPKLLDMELANELVEDGAFTTTSSDSKFCMFCGTNLPGVAKFCSSCGERQS
jgi:hypothetical protein